MNSCKLCSALASSSFEGLREKFCVCSVREIILLFLLTPTSLNVGLQNSHSHRVKRVLPT